MREVGFLTVDLFNERLAGASRPGRMEILDSQRCPA
jgi:hypothetical protein